MNSLREAEERELQLHDTVTRNIKSISSTAPRDSQALITDIYVKSRYPGHPLAPTADATKFLLWLRHP
jgi:hypothetical protein